MSDYKIIEGLPADVEADVIRYRSEGWQRNGELFHRTVDGNNIAVQGMIREADESSGKAIFVYNVVTASKFEPRALINVVYYKDLPAKEPFRSHFHYLIKIISTSEEAANKEIAQEIALQLEPIGYSGKFEFIHMEAYYV